MKIMSWKIISTEQRLADIRKYLFTRYIAKPHALTFIKFHAVVVDEREILSSGITSTLRDRKANSLSWNLIHLLFSFRNNWIAIEVWIYVFYTNESLQNYEKFIFNYY